MTTKLMSKTLKAILNIASKAKEDPKCKFTSLAHLLSEDFLKECFRELKRGKSPGIDGVTINEYEKQLDENITGLVIRLKAKQYNPKPVLRVYIPKPNGDKRPLGIPAVEDKIVQMAIKKILEVCRFLKSGIMEEGVYCETDQGTPQGGVLSPVLANIYLHYALDLWFETEVIPQLNGYARLIRYADDFVVCFENENEARAFGVALGKRMDEFGRCTCQKARKYGMKCETFDFLGFTHFCDKTRRGKFKLGRKTSRKKFTQKMKDINIWLKRIRNCVELTEWWKVLGIKLLGHYRYYGMSGNIRSLQNFYDKTVKLAFKWINRRSQKKSYNWDQFHRFIQFNPLPKPKIYHSLYNLKP